MITGEKKLSKSDKIIDKTLRKISIRKNVPKWVYVLLLLLYALSTYFLSVIARNQNVIFLFGNHVPVATFTGVMSSFNNLCLVFLVVFFYKLGYFTALIIMILQLPYLFYTFFIRHASASLPGLFTNLLTFVAITLIFINNWRMKKYQDKMHEQVITDFLTGLPNRFACTELMDRLITEGQKFALVSVDLNNFKSINDIMGHDVGNSTLKEIAQRWKSLADSRKTGTQDYITRIGGDEFAFVIRNYNSCIEILNALSAYEQELERKITINDYDYYLAASFGYAEFPDDADNSSTLFSCADAALHEVQHKNSSNKIQRFSPELLKSEKTLELERKIRNALDNDKVMFYLQPQYDVSHNLRGFEVLARIKDSDGSILQPDDFIPVAETTGLIDKVDLTVFEKSACFFKEVLNKSKKDLILCVNISVRHLMKNNFVREVKAILDKSGVPAKNIELEITESIMIDSFEKALRSINEVKNMGIKIAIDDFGTGYSSLSYLHNFPANLLKIDKSFIDLMNSSESTKKYVASIISIGHIMNLDVISEGVETAEQLNTLKSIGCDYIQGFVWGRPMPPEEALEKIMEE